MKRPETRKESIKEVDVTATTLSTLLNVSLGDSSENDPFQLIRCILHDAFVVCLAHQIPVLFTLTSLSITRRLFLLTSREFSSSTMLCFPINAPKI